MRVGKPFRPRVTDAAESVGPADSGNARSSAAAPSEPVLGTIAHRELLHASSAPWLTLPSLRELHVERRLESAAPVIFSRTLASIQALHPFSTEPLALGKRQSVVAEVEARGALNLATLLADGEPHAHEHFEAFLRLPHAARRLALIACATDGLRGDADLSCLVRAVATLDDGKVGELQARLSSGIRGRRTTLARCLNELCSFTVIPNAGGAFDAELGQREVRLLSLGRCFSGVASNTGSEVDANVSGAFADMPSADGDALRVSFSLNTHVPNQVSKRAHLADLIVYLREQHQCDCSLVEITADTADRQVALDTMDPTTTPTVKAMRALGYQLTACSVDGTQTKYRFELRAEPNASPTSEPLRRSRAPQRPLPEAVRGALREQVSRFVDHLKPEAECAASLSEARSTSGDALPPAPAHLAADLNRLFDQLNSPRVFEDFFSDVLSAAANHAWRDPRYASRLQFNKRVPRWAILKVLVERTRALGFTPTSIARKHLSREEFGAMLSAGKLPAIDRLFVGFDRLNEIPHPSILHWVQLLVALPATQKPRDVLAYLGTEEGLRYWSVLLDSYSSKATRCGYLCLGSYLRDVLRVV